MRALLQRVREARVDIAGATIGEIGPGLLVFACAMPGDDANTARDLARRIVKLRVFADAAGRMNLSLRQTGGAVLAVSQFTLAADLRRGNRPGFSGAAPPKLARDLWNVFLSALQEADVPVAAGRFGADMQVALVNDGPVTLWIDTAPGAPA